MSPGEAAAFQTLPEPERSTAFLVAWTQKEAYLKGVGTGLAGSIGSVPARVTSAGIPEWPEAASRHYDGWTLHSLAPSAGATATLAVKGNLAWDAVRLLDGNKVPGLSLVPGSDDTARLLAGYSNGTDVTEG